ncbi:hypothetical protein, partial [Streptomyces scabiei]|uniref:hypothetical protein n=1 Tax=Streptomyces scabiei TaxID=1930 RepID=UPI001C4E402E
MATRPLFDHRRGSDPDAEAGRAGLAHRREQGAAAPTPGPPPAARLPAARGTATKTPTPAS